MSDRDVGHMGEHEFEQWCSQAGLAANRPSEDAGGWDFIVQVKKPRPPAAVQSLDHLALPAVCLVQVKSTDTRATPEIALSNWRHLINPAFPAFVLLFNFGGHEHPIEAHLVHIDENLISRVVKRLRELHASDADTLHKRTVSVPWDAGNGLPELNGPAFRAVLEKHMGPDPKEYWEKKKRWYEDAGYQDARYRVSMRTSGTPEGSADDRLVDFALGLTNELPSTLMSFEEIRFGIPVPAPLGVPLPQEVKVAIPQLPHLTGTVEFSNRTGVERARLPCRFFHPRSVFPFLSTDRLRYRIAMPNFDLVFGHGANRMRLAV